MNPDHPIILKTQELEREVISLQEHVMHQEQMLDALNSVIIEQQKQIDSLTKQLKSLQQSVVQQQDQSSKDLPKGFTPLP